MRSTNQTIFAVFIQKVLPLLFLLLSACSHTPVVSSIWNSERIEVNGSPAEWSEQTTIYEEELGAIYGVLNNDQVLSLMLRTNDARMARKIARFGLNFWLSMDGNKDKRFGIRYADSRLRPLDFEELMRQRAAGRRGGGVPETGGTALLTGVFFLVDQDTLALPQQNDFGIRAAADYRDGAYCYEIELPLAINERFIAAPGGQLTLGVEIAGLSEDLRRQMQESMRNQMIGDGDAGGISGASGARPPAARAGRGGRPGGGQRMVEFESKEIWVDVKLAGGKS